MNTFFRNTIAAATLAVAAPAALASDASATTATSPVESEANRTIELAICLDTSGSMDGLIEAAKQKLWSIVNDLALAEPTPTLRVALLTFGNDGHTPESGWVRVDTPFTEDLDLVSQHLFALRTNGGTELVGRVLHASGGLEWHPSDDALKLVIVAGNESADQDKEISYRDACKALIGHGIMVNSVYCGPPTDELAPAWSEVAALADGHFACIDKDQGTVVVTTPFDEELATLSASINETYIPMGEAGATGCSNQVAQDSNAAELNSAAGAARAQTKASGLYWCRWDLVDALEQKEIDLDDVKAEDLPEAMREMTKEEQLAHIESMKTKRAEISASINELSKKRQAYIEAEMKKLALDDTDAFDNAVRTAIRAQAMAKGFGFEN